MLSQGKTMKLDEVVNLVLKQMGLDKKYKECEVSQIWPGVVGRMIASKTKSLFHFCSCQERITDGEGGTDIGSECETGGGHSERYNYKITKDCWKKQS